MQPHTYDVLARVEERHWWHRGRRQILESFIERLRVAADRDQPWRILDVGCGTGGNLTMLERFGIADGVDVSREALAFCVTRGHRRLTQASAEALPFADASFDLVTALDVIEHLHDDEIALSELHRVLRPGGHALVFVPAFMWLWGRQDDVSEHQRRYTRPQIVERLCSAGFEVGRATYANSSFLLPTLLGRLLLRATGVEPASENDLTPPLLDRPFGWLLGAERHWLARANLPVGVSVLCVARRT